MYTVLPAVLAQPRSAGNLVRGVHARTPEHVGQQKRSDTLGCEKATFDQQFTWSPLHQKTNNINYIPEQGQGLTKESSPVE